METLSRPRGLIDFESWNNIDGTQRRSTRFPAHPPKTIVLAGACVAMAAGMTIMFANRTGGRSPCSTTAAPSPSNSPTVRSGTRTPSSYSTVRCAACLRTRAEGADVTMVIVGAKPGKTVTVPANGSQLIRISLTMVRPQNADVRFVAKDIAGKEVLSAWTGRRP